jgi:hypothetical protein
MWEKFKRLVEQDTWYYALVLCLSSLASFGLGRQSVLPPAAEMVVPPPARVQVMAHQASVVTEPATQPAVPPAEPLTVPAVTVVASRSGSRYHYAHCSGAKQIKTENRIEFATAAAAEAAGYTLAANCTMPE